MASCERNWPIPLPDLATIMDWYDLLIPRPKVLRDALDDGTVVRFVRDGQEGFAISSLCPNRREIRAALEARRRWEGRLAAVWGALQGGLFVAALWAVVWWIDQATTSGGWRSTLYLVVAGAAAWLIKRQIDALKR